MFWPYKLEFMSSSEQDIRPNEYISFSRIRPYIILNFKLVQLSGKKLLNFNIHIPAFAG